MTHLGFIVPPLRKSAIVATADQIRKRLTPLMKGGVKMPVDIVYELLPDLLPGFSLEICGRDEMGQDHGLTYPAKRLIQLREDVYDGMCQGMGRDRFTGAHELGHLFLHANVPLARSVKSSAQLERYRDSEWQANTFASAFPIDEENLRKCNDVNEVMERFGVTEAAARVRFGQ